MPRIRSVHPGQWTDDEFVACSPMARLLVLGLRNEADDNGVFEWNPVKLKMRVLPADNCDVGELLAEAANKNQIHPFTVNGKHFGIIRNFIKYQKPKYPSYIYPIPEILPEGYLLSAAHSGKASGIPEQRESSGEERREETTHGANAPDMPSVASKEKPRGNGVDNCPHQQIIDLYHEKLPQCPRILKWTKAREVSLRARWREQPDIAWWRGYFSDVAASDFLVGKVTPKGDRSPFLADLEWLISPRNMAKVIEGKYGKRKNPMEGVL